MQSLRLLLPDKYTIEARKYQAAAERMQYGRMIKNHATRQ